MWSLSSLFLAEIHLPDSVCELPRQGVIGENTCIGYLSDSRQTLEATLINRSRVSDIEE